MSNQETQSKTKQLTPPELANKLDGVVDEVIRLSKIDGKENDWAREATEFYKIVSWSLGGTKGKSGVYLELSYIKRLCPELYEQVITPAVEQQSTISNIYKDIKPLERIVLIKDWDAICSATIGLSEIRIGTKYVRTRLGIDELIAVMEHELGHFQQGFIARKLTPNHVLEYQADRVSKPLDMIAVSLSKLLTLRSEF